MDQKQAQVTMRKSLTNTAATLFCILAAAAAGYIIFKYLFALTLPFLLGAGLGALASALANKLSKFTGASRKTVSFAVLIFLLASFVSLFTMFLNHFKQFLTNILLFYFLCNKMESI